MKKSFVVLLHIGFWSCYVLILIIMLGLLFNNSTFPQFEIDLIFKNIFAFAIIPSLLGFYSYYYFVLPHYLKYRNLIKTILLGLFISIVIATIGFVLLSLINDNYAFFNWRSEYIEGLLGVFFIATVTGVVALIIKGFIVWFKEIKLKDALKQRNHEMELDLVKLQLDPHFLFNTINNIDVLILKDARHASNYLNKLSDIMRFMLFEAKDEDVLLIKEIEYIEKYIELQKIRTANANYVNYNLNGLPEKKRIAPMLFIPFIENAFKHSTNKKVENAITISIKIEEKSILFECINKFDPNKKVLQESGGLGNNLIQKRLYLLYPEKHSLEVTNDGTTYNVRLIINYE